MAQREDGVEFNHVPDPVKVFRASVAALLLDDGLTIPTEAAKRTLTFTKSLVDLLGSENHLREHAVFFRSLVDKISKVIQVKNTINKEKIFQDFHKLRISEQFISLWQSYLEAVGLEVDPLFYQQVSQEIFESLLTQKFKIEHNEVPDNSIQDRLTDEEENAVNYVGGYVVRSVKDKTKDKDQLDVLKNLTGDSTNFEAQKWTKTVDRGGLVHVSEEAFRFFLAVEYATRRNLRVSNVINMDENFRNKLKNLIMGDSDVEFYWLLTGVEDEDAGELVMEKLIEKWITVRGFSFTNSILEQYKQNCKKTTAKSKSLRTKLFTE